MPRTRAIPCHSAPCRPWFAGLALSLALALGAASARSQSLRIPLQPYLAINTATQGRVGGVEGTFLVDTGEGVSAISPALAEKIGCHPWGRVTGFRMSGERLDLPRCDNVTFELGGRKFVAPSVVVLDLMSLIGSDAPPVDGAIGLDLFADRAITLLPRSAIIVETPRSLARRVQGLKPIPLRLVRDAEGLALSVNAAVQTPSGTAWFEVDTGNGDVNVIGNHVAPLLGLPADLKEARELNFRLANGIEVQGKARSRDLIMDGNIGARFLNQHELTLDLAKSQMWLRPVRH